MPAAAIPEGLKHWTADQIAECLDGIADDTYRALWQITAEAQDKKPLGGDGSDGTHEWPEVTTHHGNQPSVFWARLTEAQRENIVQAYERNAA